MCITDYVPLFVNLFLWCTLLTGLWFRRRGVPLRCRPVPDPDPHIEEKEHHSVCAPDAAQGNEESAQEKAIVIESGESNLRTPTRFLISSLLLSESFRHVCPPPSRIRPAINGFREEFHYATGLRSDPHTYVVTHIVPVKYSRQDAGGVRVTDASNISALAKLDELGLPLVMHFHSHPGFGRESNHPSLRDQAFQERLERGGHAAIGGIFSRDGFLRFFAGDVSRFCVEIHGNNVKKLSDVEFRVNVDDAPV
jgi:hypothetical protein